MGCRSSLRLAGLPGLPDFLREEGTCVPPTPDRTGVELGDLIGYVYSGVIWGASHEEQRPSGALRGDRTARRRRNALNHGSVLQRLISDEDAAANSQQKEMTLMLGPTERIPHQQIPNDRVAGAQTATI